ncbi:hypothetical protein RB195_017294 [Necator americanus]|uniref:Uncharacterized protein n=1 Tax=Necator americanus TaxID=51031 RepID=A0ABR1C4K4_NECAM
MYGHSRHDKLGEPLPLFVLLYAVDPDVKFLGRSSGANLGVKITNNDLVENIVFSVELLQLHIESFDFLLFPSLVLERKRWRSVGGVVSSRSADDVLLYHLG